MRVAKCLYPAIILATLAGCDESQVIKDLRADLKKETQERCELQRWVQQHEFFQGRLAEEIGTERKKVQMLERILGQKVEVNK